jgi:hypothetical protein
MAAEEERRGTSVDGIPSTQHWLILEGRRPRLYAAHSTMSLEEFASARGVLGPILQLAARWRRSRVA